MTKVYERSRGCVRAFRWCRGLSACLAVGIAIGCTSPAEEDGDGPPEVEPEPTVNETPAEPAVVTGANCERSAEAALAVLDTYCAGCHGGGDAARDGFDYVLDPPRLRESGKVVAGEPALSPIFVRPSTGAMPPASVEDRPGPADLDSLETWIGCGAPDPVTRAARSPISVAQIVERIAADVAAAPNDADRLGLRYVVFSNLHNAGVSDAQIESYRQALGFLLNSLSTSDEIVALDPIDAERVVYRLRLRDYGWDGDTWDAIAARYPFGVRYAAAFEFREDVADDIRSETGTDTPYLFGDWLLDRASVPPLYYDILEIPEALSQLETELNLDLDANVAAGLVSRAGFRSSEVAVNNRVIERHEFVYRENRIGEQPAVLWTTYDFANGVGNRNVFTNPLDFQADSRSMLFELPNSLFAFLVVDEAGNRVDEAPAEAGRDPEARDGVIRPGASCMGCHADVGIIVREDEVAAHTADFLGFDDLTRVRQVYVSAATFGDLQSADAERFETAAAEAGPSVERAEALNGARTLYQSVLGRADVAAVTGLSAEEFEQALADDRLPPEVLPLRGGRGTIPRDVFEDIFPELVEQMGLGRSIDNQVSPL